MLAALNTGHDGGCGTVHANSAADVPARLEALGLSAGLSRPALHAQLAAAVDVVIHLVRTAGGQRQVREVRVLTRGTDGCVVAEPALVFADGKVCVDAGEAELRRRLTLAHHGRARPTEVEPARAP